MRCQSRRRVLVAASPPDVTIMRYQFDRGIFFAASPPDVRKVSDLPRVAILIRAMPRFFQVGGAFLGAKPPIQSDADRKVRDLPHIRRQSRRTRVFPFRPRRGTPL